MVEEVELDLGRLLRWWFEGGGCCSREEVDAGGDCLWQGDGTR